MDSLPPRAHVLLHCTRRGHLCINIGWVNSTRTLTCVKPRLGAIRGFLHNVAYVSCLSRRSGTEFPFAHSRGGSGRFANNYLRCEVARPCRFMCFPEAMLAIMGGLHPFAMLTCAKGWGRAGNSDYIEVVANEQLVWLSVGLARGLNSQCPQSLCCH